MTELVQFEEFMTNYQDMVYSTALRLLGNETEAQDIAQAVFLKAYEAFAQIEHSPTAGGWLKTVATHLSLNHLTRYRARWKLFSDLRPAGDDREFVDDLEDPRRDSATHRLDGAERNALLDSALLRLPNDQRVPLVLYHFDDLPYETIAEKLGVSLSKVKTDIHRGRMALRRFLDPHRGDLGREPASAAAGAPTPKGKSMPRSTPGVS
jgi:RNA polymerase sigma-70 factor (ECF subfamily)